MCISVPARIVAVDGAVALIDIGGTRQSASTLRCPDLAVGDWVTVAGGSIVGRITRGEATEIAAILQRALTPVASSSHTIERRTSR